MLRSFTHKVPNLGYTPTILQTQRKVGSLKRYILLSIFACLVLLSAYYVLFWPEDRSTSRGLAPLSNHFRVLLVADRDEFSFNKDKNKWESVLSRGSLSRLENGEYAYQARDSKLLSHDLARKDRGIELSELKFFDEKSDQARKTSWQYSMPRRLLAFDDRAGIVYEIMNWNQNDPLLIPRAIISAGDGLSEPKPLKSEWVTEKDNKLIVGSWGKEFTTPDGRKVVSRERMMYVKVLDRKLGIEEHRDWINTYQKLRQSVGIRFPGYLVHEAVEWSPIHKKWFFLPRRFSKERYDDQADLKRGSNLLIIANEDFSHFSQVRVNQSTQPTRGFSSFKFIPGSHDEHIIALKSEERGESQHSYVTVFDIRGNVLMPETFIGDEKFEGIEIVYDDL